LNERADRLRTPTATLIKARCTNLVRVDGLEVLVENSSADPLRDRFKILEYHTILCTILMSCSRYIITSPFTHPLNHDLYDDLFIHTV